MNFFFHSSLHVCYLFFQENPGISMTNKFGQKYFCTLPKSLQDDNDDDGGDAGDKKSSVKLVHGPDNIPELLAPMAKEPCLMKTKDWWTYEVCYKKIAKQYHLEGSKCHNFFLVASIGKLFLQNYSSTMKAKPLTKRPSQFYDFIAKVRVLYLCTHTMPLFVLSKAATASFLEFFFHRFSFTTCLRVGFARKVVLW